MLSSDLQATRLDATRPNVSRNSSGLLDEHTRRTRLLQILSLMAVACHICGITTVIGMSIVSGQLLLISGPVSSLLAIPCFLIAHWLGGRHHYEAGCWLLVLSNSISIAVYYWLLGTDVLVVMVFMIPVSLAVVLMKTPAVIVITSLDMSFSAGIYLAQHLFKFYQPPVTLSQEILLVPNLVVLLIIVPLIITLLVIPARSLAHTLQLFQLQSSQLQLALGEVETRQRVSQQVSQQVSALATQLNITATQQVSGSQEQAVVVKQVSSSVSELSMAAISIDGLADQVNSVAANIARDSQLIEETSNLSVSHNQQGLAAIGRTIEVSSDIARLYTSLMNDLAEQNTKNLNMRMIIDLLSSIANQTHLLSLNASIEAAGAGQYGERFAVVAQEVKMLAERSTNASREVSNIIREAETSALTAQLSAKDGYHKAQEMNVVVEQTGRLFDRMYEVVLQAQGQASSITKDVRQARDLSVVIKAATAQQLSASQQVLDALHELSNVATEGASTSTQVSTAVVDLESLSLRLDQVLAG